MVLKTAFHSDKKCSTFVAGAIIKMDYQQYAFFKYTTIKIIYL